mmetsp:Transcript_13048/g.19709  ORF Transcript_13048/g.19709 Transcript_13048/m.19709 type:complete len:279 (+) Transcript_13048:251-1087(+)
MAKFGTAPVVCTSTREQLITSTPDTTLLNTTPVRLHESKVMAFTFAPSTLTTHPSRRYKYTVCLTSVSEMMISLLLVWCSTTHLLPCNSNTGSYFFDDAAPPHLRAGAVFFGVLLTVPPARKFGFLCVCMSLVTFLRPVVTAPPLLSSAKSPLAPAVFFGAATFLASAALLDAVEEEEEAPPADAALSLASPPFGFHHSPWVCSDLTYFSKSAKNPFTAFTNFTWLSSPLCSRKIRLRKNAAGSANSFTTGPGTRSIAPPFLKHTHCNAWIPSASAEI